jgi:hypothetical protein
VALLWGLPLLAVGFKPQTAVLRVLLPAAYLLAIVLPPLPFINCQLDFYAQASRVVRQMGQLGAVTPSDRELIFANLPYFFSSYDGHPDGCPSPYPWTPVGAVVVPPYAQARDFVRFNGGPDRPVTAVSIPDYAPGWNTYGPDRSLAEIRDELSETTTSTTDAASALSASVYVFNLSNGDFFDLTNAWQPDEAIIQPKATFADEFAVIGTQVNRNSDEIEVVVDWQVLKEGERPLTVFVHLYDSTGALVAQHDGPPAQGFVPWPFWQTGDIITDRHVVPLPAPLGAGDYRLAVGLYNSNSGERLAGKSDSGPLFDNVYVLEQFTTP